MKKLYIGLSVFLLTVYAYGAVLDTHEFKYTPYDGYNTVATTSGWESVAQGTSSGLYYWTNKSASSFTMTGVGIAPNSYWTSQAYVYVVIDNATSYLYNQQYIYGSSTKTNINDSFVDPVTVNSFTVDGRTVAVKRLTTTAGYKMSTFECVTCINAFGTSSAQTRMYLAMPSNSASLMNSVNSEASLVSFINANAPAVIPSAIISTSTRYVSQQASIYSQLSTIVNPVTTTSYTYTSPTASTTLKQGGVIFITHASTTNPTITWGGVSMAKIQYTTAQTQGYVTSLYYVANPASLASIVVSNIVATTTRFISTSVWSNANLVANADTFSVTSSNNRAWIDLAGAISPVTVVGALSATDLNGYQKLSATTIVTQATSSTGQLGVFSGQCTTYGGFGTCPFGYNFQYAFGYVDGGVLGLSLYATTTATTTYSTNTASTTIPTSTFFTDLGSDLSFSACFNDVFNASILTTQFYSNLGSGFTCIGKNLFFWALGLFIPTSDQVNELGTNFYSSLQNGNLVTSVFAFAFYLKELSATTTPVDTVSLYGFTVPTSISGGTYSTSTQMITLNVGQVSSSTDRMARNFLNPFFAVFALFFMGYFMIKLLH